MRQTAPPEMVMGSLHYVHDLASFDQVRRNQTREGPPDHGFRAIPLTAGQAGQLLSNEDLNSQMMNSTINNSISDSRQVVEQQQLQVGKATVGNDNHENKYGRLMHARGTRKHGNDIINRASATVTDDSGYQAGEMSFRGTNNQPFNNRYG